MRLPWVVTAPLVGSVSKSAPTPFQLAAADSEVFIFDAESREPKFVWRKVVALDNPVDFDLLELQSRFLSAVLESNLPGGLAGALRFDNFIARTFEVELSPLDEQHVELILRATPDKGVSFQQLQRAFEKAIEASSAGIPKNTFDRVEKRFDSYWPDWEDKGETADWMANYVLDRVSQLRKPLSNKQLRGMAARLKIDDVNSLLKAFEKPGRQAVALIGRDQGENQ